MSGSYVSLPTSLVRKLARHGISASIYIAKDDASELTEDDRETAERILKEELQNVQPHAANRKGSR